MSEALLACLEKNNDKTVFKTLALEVLKVDPEETIIAIKIDDRHRQHFGLVHGGIYTLLAESAASIAAASGAPEKSSTVALEINANHVCAMREGTLLATAKPLHRGQKTCVYEVRLEDQGQKLISIARCTLLILKEPWAVDGAK